MLEQGWDALNTNKVAQRAGVNIASLYQYFPNKEALLVEVMRRHARETRQAILDVMVARRGRKTLKDDVRALIDATIAAHAISPKLHAILTLEGARLHLDRLETEVDDALLAEHKLWMTATARDHAPSELGMWMAITGAHAIIHSACLERPRDVQRPEFAEELTRLITPFIAGA